MGPTDGLQGWPLSENPLRLACGIDKILESASFSGGHIDTFQVIVQDGKVMMWIRGWSNLNFDEMIPTINFKP